MYACFISSFADAILDNRDQSRKIGLILFYNNDLLLKKDDRRIKGIYHYLLDVLRMKLHSMFIN